MNTKLSLFPICSSRCIYKKGIRGDRARTLSLFIHIVNMLSEKTIAIYLKILKNLCPLVFLNFRNNCSSEEMGLPPLVYL